MYPTRIYVGEDGSFVVGENLGTRFTWYTPDGELVETVPGTPTSVTYDGFRLNLEAPLSDGGFLAVQRIPLAATMGFRDRPPISTRPLLRVLPPEDGLWRVPQPVFRVDVRNRYAAIRRGDQTRFTGQPFGDEDLWRIHPRGAVVARRNGDPGVVDLIALDARGDTLWRRSLSLSPHRLTTERVEAAIESWVASRARSSQQPPGTLRQAYESALYKPEYLPAVESMFLSASGEVWLETHERSGNLRVFYTLRQDDPSMPLRRILLPEEIWFQDATETHVWGIRRDQFDVPHIVGLRLLPR